MAFSIPIDLFQAIFNASTDPDAAKKLLEKFLTLFTQSNKASQVEIACFTKFAPQMMLKDDDMISLISRHNQNSYATLVKIPRFDHIWPGVISECIRQDWLVSAIVVCKIKPEFTPQYETIIIKKILSASFIRERTDAATELLIPMMTNPSVCANMFTADAKKNYPEIVKCLIMHPKFTDLTPDIIEFAKEQQLDISQKLLMCENTRMKKTIEELESQLNSLKAALGDI